jgi:hypothetical protein
VVTEYRFKSPYAGSQVRFLSASDLASLLDAKPSGNGWSAKCPIHDDQHESLSISEGGQDRVLYHCFAGCSQDALTAEFQRRGWFKSKDASNGHADEFEDEEEETEEPEPETAENTEDPGEIVAMYDHCCPVKSEAPVFNVMILNTVLAI